MDAAAVVTILAIVLIILALVVFLVGVILELRKITAGLDVVIGAVGEILRKTEPVNEVVYAINADLGAGTELLEGLLLKKAGPEDGPGLVESVFPGGGAAMLEREGRSGPVKNIDVVYTRGAVQLVRLGRESLLGAGGEAGPALRDAEYSSTAARSLYSNPTGPEPGARSRPGSPTIGSGAPAVFGSVTEAPTSRRRARRSTWMPETPPMRPWTSPRRPSRAPRTKSRRRTSASAHAPATSGRPSSVPGTRREPRKHRHQLSTSARPASRTRSRCWRRAGPTPG